MGKKKLKRRMRVYVSEYGSPARPKLSQTLLRVLDKLFVAQLQLLLCYVAALTMRRSTSDRVCLICYLGNEPQRGDFQFMEGIMKKPCNSECAVFIAEYY
jgi:hypothetical protein